MFSLPLLLPLLLPLPLLFLLLFPLQLVSFRPEKLEVGFSIGGEIFCGGYRASFGQAVYGWVEARGEEDLAGLY